MTEIRSAEIAHNSGWAATIEKGQALRVTASTVAAVVCFNARDLGERFDQARTRVYNMRIWITAGEQLFSKLNNPMMTMTEDGFAPHGRHDLQYGACSGPILARAAAEGVPRRWAFLKGRAVPAHGCLESLAGALSSWRIAMHDIPMPLNLFQHTEIDTTTGAIRPLTLRPSAPATVALRAEMDLVVAVAACPDPEAAGGGQPVRVAIMRGA